MSKEHEPEPENKEGGIPEWGQKLQQAVEELSEKLTSQPQDKQVEIPVPAEPKHEEPEPVIELPEPEPEPQPEPKQPTLKRLLSWLF